MDIKEAVKKIRYEDLTPPWQEIVDSVGMETFLIMCYYFGGQAYYFPEIDRLAMENRDREIRREFCGWNYRLLGEKFGLSERHIRKIIKGTRK